MARRMSSPIMVGRGSESRAFAAALQEARHGRTSVLIVGGEAGVGKTRLVAEFAATTRADGGTAVVGAAPPPAGGRPTPFAALTPVLRGLIRSIDARLVDSMLGAARDDLAALLPELGSRPARKEEPEPFAAARLAESVLVTLEVVARLRPPVMIAIEDVHWADDATRAIVSYACRTLVDAKVVVVVTYRSDVIHDADSTLEFIAELTRLPGAEHIELGPLNADDVSEQVRAILGSDPEAELIRALVRRSDGNPFFVEELVAAVIEGGIERPPPSVRTMVASRMASVSEPSRTLVEIASIADPNVPAELLAIAAAMTPDAFDVAVREAWDANLLVRSSDPLDDATAPGGIERLDLRHVLVREVILSSLSAPRRQELHARLADAIEAHPAIAGASPLERNARLASHRLMARQLERAVPPLLREATAAEDVRAFVIADQAYRRALDAISQLGVDAAVRQDLPTTLERAALAASLAGDPSRAVRLAQDALATGPDEAGSDRPPTAPPGWLPGRGRKPRACPRDARRGG